MGDRANLGAVVNDDHFEFVAIRLICETVQTSLQKRTRVVVNDDYSDFH